MVKKYYRFYGLVIITALIVALAACSGKKDLPDEILTQKAVAPDKTQITVLVKYAFSINAFEKAVEEHFPQLDLIQVGNFTSDMGINEYKARLKNDDLTDVVMTWPLNVGEEYWQDRLLDLSSFPMTSQYTTSMLNNISKDGKLFYLPGPSQVRGIVYNKTLFAENGWEVPKDFEGFIALCKEIEKTGMRALQLGLGNAEVFDTAFTGYGYEGSYSTPKNAQAIADYNNGIGSFRDNFTPALETFQRLVDEGILRKSDLNVYYSDREAMIFSRECAMIEDSVLVARMGPSYNGCTDEFALMPFFNPGVEKNLARLYPVCYIGVNKQLSSPENAEKYDMVMELLRYISTPEGQKVLAEDTGAMFSSLKGVPPPDIPEIKDLIPALTQGRYAVFTTLKNAQSALRQGLAGMLDGTLTSDDVIKMVDEENLNPLASVPDVVIGTVAEDFSLIETGNFLTDAMSDQSGCEIALFLDNGKDGRYNGKGISGRFYKGEIVASDIKRVLPDLKYGEKGELWKITMTGEDLLKTLEYAIPVSNNINGWFYYFSGLRVDYDPIAEPGKRIQKITDDTGKAIDKEEIYSIAVMDESVPEEFIKTCEKTGITIYEVLEKAVKDGGDIKPSGDGRFTVSRP